MSITTSNAHHFIWIQILIAYQLLHITIQPKKIILPCWQGLQYTDPYPQKGVIWV